MGQSYVLSHAVKPKVCQHLRPLQGGHGMLCRIPKCGEVQNTSPLALLLKSLKSFQRLLKGFEFSLSPNTLPLD